MSFPGAAALLATVVFLAPGAPPRILATHLSTSVAHSGQLVRAQVETSSNVASVVARVGSYSQAMQKTGVGRFRATVRVPHLPFFMHGRWMISFIANNTAGLRVVTSMPIMIR